METEVVGAVLMVVVRVAWRFWRVGGVWEGGGGGGEEAGEEDDGEGAGEEDDGGGMASVTIPVRGLEHEDARACARAPASSILSSIESQTVVFLARSAWPSHGSPGDCAGSSAGRNACCGASLKPEYRAAEVGGGYKNPERRRKKDPEVCIVRPGMCSC